ncbi:MAG: hypothetical protein ABI134_01785 [Byssovorax sp.]
MSLEEKAKKLAEAEKERVNVDWNAERDWWLKALNALHQEIEAWLTPLKQKGLVAIKKTPVRLSEENIGAYAADALVLEFGPQGIVLQPAGTLIVGARGRVDMFRRGSRGEPLMLILAGSKQAAKWEIWPTRDPRQRKPMDQSTFEGVLESMLEA